MAKKLTLHLGVLVQSYPTSRKRDVSTADVAGWLEEQYGVMGVFFKSHEQLVVGAISDSLLGAIQAGQMGQRIDPFGRGTQRIDRSFREFISSRKAEQVGIPGTPTHAALMGYSSRNKNYHKRGPRRPSFRDTGLYMNSFRSWID